MKRQKILLVSHHWPINSHHSKSSGYERLAGYLAEQYQVEVLTAGQKTTVTKESNLTVHYHKTPKSNFLFEKRLGLAQQAKKMANDYDLVHCLYSDVSYFFKKQDKVIVTEHDLPEINPSLWMKYKSIIQKPSLKKASLVIAVSTNLEKIIRQKYNSSVVYIPHGVDTNVFTPIKVSQLKKDQLLGKQFKHICLSVGIQGVDSKVFQKIASQFPEIIFIVIGRSEKNNQHNNIYLPGKVSEDKLIDFYSLADICFKPLKFATANNSILEAMSMGKTTITNSIDGIKDYLTESQAYLADSNKDFYQLFQKAIKNKRAREEKGRQGRKRAEEEFSWVKIAEKITNIYQQYV